MNKIKYCINPFIKREINFSEFCRQLCEFAFMEYYPDVENGQEILSKLSL